ncbi:MAG: hypothetical protein ACI30O_00940 [Muribaculaceae bacterium]
MDKNQEAKNALINVRRAFRTLASYQQSMLSIADYIRNRTGIPGCGFYGGKRFSNPIGKCQLGEDYDANLKIFPKMWSWDFLYGYFFEYYLGTHDMDTSEGKKNVSISIIQISDDGYIRSTKDDKRRETVSTFVPPETSESHIMICIGHDDGWFYVPEALSPEAYSATPWADCVFHTVNYMIQNNMQIYVNRNGVNNKPCLFIAGLFPMESFFNSKSIDNILHSFGERIKAESGINIFI